MGNLMINIGTPETGLLKGGNIINYRLNIYGSQINTLLTFQLKTLSGSPKMYIKNCLQ